MRPKEVKIALLRRGQDKQIANTPDALARIESLDY